MQCFGAVPRLQRMHRLPGRIVRDHYGYAGNDRKRAAFAPDYALVHPLAFNA